MNDLTGLERVAVGQRRAKLQARERWSKAQMLLLLIVPVLAWSFFTIESEHSRAVGMAEVRAAHAAELAALPETAEEQRWSRHETFPAPMDSTTASTSDQIAADGALVTYYSAQASDRLNLSVVVATAALTSLVIALHGIRSLLQVRMDRRHLEEMKARDS